MANIIVPEWDRRKLNPGFVWQEYLVCATQKITTPVYRQRFSTSMISADYARNRWEDQVMAYMKSRCEELGMHCTKVEANCQSEPDPEKPLESVIWDSLNLAFVWSIWAYVDAPIAEGSAKPGCQLPLEGFWPGSVGLLPGGIAEILDAETMLRVERGIEV